MSTKSIAGILLGVVWLFANGLSVLAQSQPGREYSPQVYEEQSAARGLKRVDPDRPVAFEVFLPELTTAEQSSLSRSQLGEPLEIGIHRSIPEEWRGTIGPAELDWETAVGGSRVATFRVRSSGAQAVRVAIAFMDLPEGAEIRYYDPESPDTFFGPYLRGDVSTVREGSGKGEPYWSPLITGEAVAVEISVPDRASTNEVWISLRQVSHVLNSPFDVGFFKYIGDAGRCNKDLACSAKWEMTGASVALVIFEEGRNAFACTGQLVNQTDFDGTKFLFLTARHCIGRGKVARSATFLWFFQKAKCRGAPPDSMVQTSGGAILKYRSPKVGRRRSTDHSLLQLRRDPPAGVTLSGWAASHFSNHVGEKVFGIHHPSGDLKKISRGDIFATGFIEGDYLYLHPSRVSHYIVLWNKGVVETGSSGSGLWEGTKWPDQYLIGLLTGGLSSCRDRHDPDFYGMLSETYRRSRKFRRLMDSQ